MCHNTAKSNKAGLRQLRIYSKIFSTPGGEAAFKDMENSSKILNEMSVSVHGDLGNIFRYSCCLFFDTLNIYIRLVIKYMISKLLTYTIRKQIILIF